MDPILSNWLNLKQESPDYADDQISCQMSSWLRKLDLEQVQLLFLQNFDVIFQPAKLGYIQFIVFGDSIVQQNCLDRDLGLKGGRERTIEFAKFSYLH